MVNDWLQKISPYPHVIGHGPARIGWVEPPRYIVDHELVMFSKGEIWININGEEFICKQDSFIIVPPGVEHASANRQKSKSHRYWIHFDWLFTKPLDDLRVWSFLPARFEKSQIRYAPQFVPNTILYGQISSKNYTWELFDRLCQRWNQGDNLDRLSCRGLLLELLILLLGAGHRISEENDNSLRLARRMRQLLTSASDIGISEMPSLPEIFSDFGRSYPHLCRIFHSTYGISPVEYINAIRIERAKLLLRDTNMPIVEIAKRVGFDNPAYFSRMFRKISGKSPSKFSASPTSKRNVKVAIDRRRSSV